MTSYNTIQAPSPNHDARGNTPVDMVVLHYTGMQSGAEALARLRDKAAKVSAHYLIEESGQIFALVPEERRAWHAGVSHWQGRDGVNDGSVGIEIVNPGHEWGYRAFPAVQVDALLVLLKDICVRWMIPSSRVVGHSDVAPERKEDPGELFPWNALAKERLAIGLFPSSVALMKELPDYQCALQMLREIGYRVLDNQHAAPVLAFQRRFCPKYLGKGLDQDTKKALVWAHKEFTNP